jgi:hypothetical protein
MSGRCPAEVCHRLHACQDGRARCRYDDPALDAPAATGATETLVTTGGELEALRHEVSLWRHLGGPHRTAAVALMLARAGFPAMAVPPVKWIHPGSNDSPPSTVKAP